MGSVDPHLSSLSTYSLKPALRHVQRFGQEEFDVKPSQYALRNLMLSLALLIAVIVSATFSLRDATTPTKSKPARECPLQFIVGSPSELDVGPIADKVADECLEDSSVDWDKVFMTRDFKCVLDPSRLPIHCLLLFPPPTFKREVGCAVSYLSSMSQMNADRQYVTIAQ